MESSALASRPQVTIVNGTRGTVWVAIYKRSSRRTNEPPIAWQVVSPPPRGNTAVFIPRDYQICARYSFEPENPRQPVYQTNILQAPHAPAGAGFVLECVSSPDRRTWGAVLKRMAESPGPWQIRVLNRFSIGIWGHLRQEGRDIFPPRVLPPMTAWVEDLNANFYVAVLSLPQAAGDPLLDSEISLTETAVKAGERVKIQQDPRRGFKISIITPGTSSTAFEEPDLPTQAPCVPEEKPKARARVRPKAGPQKQEAAKKGTKKPTKRVAPKASRAKSNPTKRRQRRTNESEREP